MPLVIRKQDLIATVEMLRVVQDQAADRPTMLEAKRLADLWELQLSPEAIIIPGLT